MPELQILTFAQFELTTAEILFVIITGIVFALNLLVEFLDSLYLLCEACYFLDLGSLKQFHIFIHLFNIFQEIILFYLTIHVINVVKLFFEEM